MAHPVPSVRRTDAGTLPDGRTVDRWTLDAPGGTTAELLGLGARLQALRTPDRHGRTAGIVLASDRIPDLLGEGAYLGATVGRYGNRIARGELPLDGAVHRLATQPAGHTLHGGPDGFATRLWDAAPVHEAGRAGVRFRLHSPDGDQGFPGALTAQVTYLLDTDGALTIHYAAVTDAPTVVNLTNHAYFDLAGEGEGGLPGHRLTVDADHYLPVDAGLIPLGPAAPVAGTPFDLTAATPLAGRLGLDDPQLRIAGGGFDHNWVLRPSPGNEPRRVAVLSHPASGRRLEVLTTEPGLQVYTGNHFDGALTGRSGRPYRRHAGIALETQHHPDSPHRPDYPSTVLRPGVEYVSTTVYRCAADAGESLDDPLCER